MPNISATRSGITGLAAVLTVAAAPSKGVRSVLLSLLALSASGCGSPSNVAPTPVTPTPTPPPSPSVPVSLEGRVLDEREEPIEGATITGSTYFAGSLANTSTDNAGRFSLTVDLQERWDSVTLRAVRDGYETARVNVHSDEAARAILVYVYRSLTISPGESIQTTLSDRPIFDCGFYPVCRRAVVNAASGTRVDVGVMPADGQEYAGLAFGDQLIWGYNFPGQVTMSGGGEVWIVGHQPGRVTLRAAGQ
jgi:hypothetical protein